MPEEEIDRLKKENEDLWKAMYSINIAFKIWAGVPLTVIEELNKKYGR
jgi:hypothetical protein